MRYALGWNPDRLDHRDYKFVPPFTVGVDQTIDLRSAPAMPPIYNQEDIGSCVGNGTAAAFQWARISESAAPPWNPSRLFIYYNARKMEGTADQDSGCEIRDAVKSLNTQGVVPESEWPYDTSQFATQPPANLYTVAEKNELLQYASVKQAQAHILACLAHHGPVVFGASVFQAIMDAPGGHIPMPGPDDEPVGGHCMVLVGWLPQSNEYIIRNSWGTDWGDKGYGYMPADYVHNADLASDFWVLWLTEKNKAAA